MKHRSSAGTLCFLSLAVCGTVPVAELWGQDILEETQSQMSLRKSAEIRQYQGQTVEGENRQIAPGDSLWRILIQEKNLPERKFGQSVAMIQALNPKLKSTGILQVGDTVFIPTRLDTILGAPSSVSNTVSAPTESFGQGSVKPYRVQRGNYLYQILREQLGIKGERELAVYFALVKDLNPQRKNWDSLQEGEMIRLPTAATNRALQGESASSLAPETGTSARSQQAIIPPAEISPTPRAPLPLNHASRLVARENLPLLEQVLNLVGGEVQTDGQEIFSLIDGTFRIDKRSYPMVFNRKLQQKVILDPAEQIPASLRNNLQSPDVAASVMSLRNTATLHETTNDLLMRLGYQALPSGRSIVVQDGGVALEAKGTWIVLAPEESGKAQEAFIITITDQDDEVPDYLREQLSAKGVHLKDVVLPSSFQGARINEPVKLIRDVKIWPKEKSEKIDSLLLAYGIPFRVAETQSVELREGLRFETRIDRVFESKGNRIGLFFRALEPETKAMLQERQGMKVVELDLARMSPTEIISRVLDELGDQTVYRQHKFAADTDNKERVVVSASGFWLRNRSMFLTDRQIPTGLHRFFFEKGLELVYFE